ncbi:MAG TPA: 30S ribosomal protein S8e [Candidatus Nanoarchaeia archaeon]|nr:30S ribosomal protein S8e [Candidatus Nanoarchaeia archaeon]
MVVYQKRSRRKVSGGRYIVSEKKKYANIGSLPTFTRVGDRKLKIKRATGGNLKQSLLTANKVNVMNPKTKKSQITDVVTVVENPANRNFIRRNIITKGTILETKLGKVKITSRPGQEGTLNGILLQ